MAGSGLTFTDIINEALGILGVYQGDPLDAADLQAAFFTLQAIIDGYPLEALTIQQDAVLQYTTQANKQSYTFGPGSNWVTSWLPPSFTSVKMLSGAGSGAIEYDVAISSFQEWADIGLKSLGSNILTNMWPNLGPTAHTLNFWPLPSVAQTVNLYVPQPIAKPTAATNSFVAGFGYQEMMTFELVIKASSKFKATIPAWIPEAYREAKEKVKASNFEALLISCDPALIAVGSQNRTVGGGSLDFYLGK